VADFVNPYTFVPHAAVVERGKPNGHDALGEGNLSGFLSIRLTARTPLLIGGFGTDQGPDLPRRLRDRRVIIPGSGLMGAVRSVHETLVGGCMRVLHSDLVPAHRHPATSKETKNLRLAVVTEVKDGRAAGVRLCDEWIWVAQELLPRRDGELPRTGDQIQYQPTPGVASPVTGDMLAGVPGRRLLQPIGGAGPGDEDAPGGGAGDGRARGGRTGDRGGAGGQFRGRGGRGAPDEKPKGIAPGALVTIGRMGRISEECWVLLVTDTHARASDKPTYFACGRIGPDGPSYRVSDGAWARYLLAVAGADDQRPEKLKHANAGGSETAARGAGPGTEAEPPRYAGQPAGQPTDGKPSQDDAEPPWDDPGNPRYVKVGKPGTDTQAEADADPIAQRLPVRTYLYEGQPVWVQVSEKAGKEVTEIRLSQFWRYVAGESAGDRAGEAAPCTGERTDPEKEELRLCWSCRIFGSADTEGRQDDQLAVQNSYRGHVRFDDLVAEEEDFPPLIWKLAPLANPKPSAGQFYLDNSGRGNLADKDTRAMATWGSAADDRRARPLRGRKYYWRTVTETDATGDQPAGGDSASGRHPRWRHRAHQSENMSGDAALIPAAKTFRGRVAFDNLSRADLGSLLAALDPRLLARADGDRAADWQRVVGSVGGGKPFGFGAMTIDIVADGDAPTLTAQSATERYLGDAAQPPHLDDVLSAFLAAVPASARNSWPALRNALTFGYVSDDLVWYPPGGGTGGSGPKGEETYDKSFDYFAITNGLQFDEHEQYLVELPPATAPPEQQVLDSTGNVRDFPGRKLPRGDGNTQRSGKRGGRRG
jgi:hypothetical protein